MIKNNVDVLLSPDQLRMFKKEMKIEAMFTDYHILIILN